MPEEIDFSDSIEEQNDKAGGKGGQNPAKKLKNEMHAWVRDQVADGAGTKSRMILAAEERFGIPFRTSGDHLEKPQPVEANESVAKVPPPEPSIPQKNVDGVYACIHCANSYKTISKYLTHLKKKHGD